MMPARDITVAKVGHDGEVLLRYAGELVYVDDRQLVARCPWPSDATYDLGPFNISAGDIFVEFYYPDEWFNIFAIYDGFGLLKGWYCNITYPVEIRRDEIRWHDLALDLLVLPDGEQQELDRAEYEALDLTAATRAKAEAALETLQRAVPKRQLAFWR